MVFGILNDDDDDDDDDNDAMLQCQLNKMRRCKHLFVQKRRKCHSVPLRYIYVWLCIRMGGEREVFFEHLEWEGRGRFSLSI